MSAEKLYYTDPHLFDFSAIVTSCRKDGDRYAVTLDRTAFFPEGGGQQSDTGFIGDVEVTYVYEKNGEVFHVCGSSADVGRTYECRIDGERRLGFMKKHTAEHIISGIIHNRFGYDNVGFHLSENETTLDTSGKLTPEDIAAIELEANRVIQSNVEVRAFFPAADELADIDYRSKKEIDGDLRIVIIEGVDACACCAPHVYRTGEIGLVKILKYYSWKGGMRLHITAGLEAYRDYADKYDTLARIAKAHSCGIEDVEDMIAKTESGIARLKDELRKAEALAVRAVASSAASSEGEYFCYITDMLSPDAAVKLAEECAGHKTVAAVFTGSGDTYNFVICSKTASAKEFTDRLKQSIDLRGGGNDRMTRGRATAAKEDIEQLFDGAV
ncbi:MAG: alanyl-tRNA editing protein [Clostridia bacterium]|nr:alanyl-tRNA editing protein [Clostridia bacterium]